MIVNPETGNTVWYHSTTPDRVTKILKDGLKIFSRTSHNNENRVPWLYVSSRPFSKTNPTFLVDMADIEDHEVQLVFEQDNDKQQNLRVFVNIPVDKLTLLTDR